MKTLVLGDIHGRTIWKLIIHREQPNKVIFVGDYFDSYEYSLVEQIHNFKQLMALKEQYSNIEFIFLIGNHDYHYFPEIGWNGTSGHQGPGAAVQIGQLLDEFRKNLQMAYKMDNILCTHAGVSIQWLDNNGWDGVQPIDEFVNEMWKHKPKEFNHCGMDGSGDDTYQTPIWIRPRSLMKANRDTLRTKIIQIVGHTSMYKIDIQGKSTGGRYYFIDTLAIGEYLVINNGYFAIGKV